MTTPIATEIIRRLEPVARDPFIDRLPAPAIGPDLPARAPRATPTRGVALAA